MAEFVGPKKIAGPPVAPGQVSFTTQAGDSVTAWVNGIAKPLDGAFGGYASAQRTARRAITVYQGVDVIGMTIPILLDGWAEQQAVSPQKRLLEAMAGPSGKDDLTPPQPVLVTGTVPYPNRWWVIQALALGDVTKLRASDGVCLRQDYVATVITPPGDGVIVTKGKRYTVRKGDTLTSIAARQLGKASRWREIKNSAGHAIRDPKSIKPGQIVKLP